MCVIGLFKHDRKSIFLWESCIVNILARWILFDEAVMACFGRWQHCVSGQQGHKTRENVNGLMPLAMLLGVFITLLARYCDCCQHLLGSGSSLLGQDRCKWSVDQFTKIRLLRSALTPATGDRSSFPLWKYQIFTDIILLFCINWNTAV